jgi:diadenosine hexaphosphate hydrolase (ATP-forming)
MVEESAGPAVTGRDNDGASREFSSGGVIVVDGRVLLVKTRNLKGELLWTFPKGHVEEGETVREAALREVEEETGYRCRITKPICTARYRFQREGRTIHKRVQWFWMEAGSRLGKPDGAEIAAVRWASFKKAAELLSYPTDCDLLERTKKRFGEPKVKA